MSPIPCPLVEGSVVAGGAYGLPSASMTSGRVTRPPSVEIRMTADVTTANRVGGQMVCGYVWVNDHGATRLDLRAPFGGMKQSGIGREQGIEGIRAFQDTRSISHLVAAVLASMAH